jgi:hypothetical protein
LEWSFYKFRKFVMDVVWDGIDLLAPAVHRSCSCSCVRARTLSRKLLLKLVLPLAPDIIC